MLKILKAYGIPDSLVAANRRGVQKHQSTSTYHRWPDGGVSDTLRSLTGRYVATLYLCDNAGPRP